MTLRCFLLLLSDPDYYEDRGLTDNADRDILTPWRNWANQIAPHHPGRLVSHGEGGGHVDATHVMWDIRWIDDGHAQVLVQDMKTGHEEWWSPPTPPPPSLAGYATLTTEPESQAT